MQIHIDPRELPEGMTLQNVYDTIVLAIDGYIGETECSEHPCEKEKAVRASLIDPERPEDHLNPEDLDYLRQVAKCEHNDWQQGWRANKRSRARLQRLGLVTVTFHKATNRPGDCDVTYCRITRKGREAAKRV